MGYLDRLGELQSVHQQNQISYQKACEKIKDQSQASEFQLNEKVTIYHHEVHKKIIRKSSILILETPQGEIKGHELCADFLENEVKSLLLVDAGLDTAAQDKLLEEVEPIWFPQATLSVFLICSLVDILDSVPPTVLVAEAHLRDLRKGEASFMFFILY